MGNFRLFLVSLLPYVALVSANTVPIIQENENLSPPSQHQLQPQKEALELEVVDTSSLPESQSVQTPPQLAPVKGDVKQPDENRMIPLLNSLQGLNSPWHTFLHDYLNFNTVLTDSMLSGGVNQIGPGGKLEAFFPFGRTGPEAEAEASLKVPTAPKPARRRRRSMKLSDFTSPNVPRGPRSSSN